MIKNIIGAVVGAKLMGESPKVDNAAGAATGAFAATAIPFALSRLSLPAMLAIGVGGYLYKKHRDKQFTEHTDAVRADGPEESAGDNVAEYV